jgi:hypothetical protein
MFAHPKRISLPKDEMLVRFAHPIRTFRQQSSIKQFDPISAKPPRGPAMEDRQASAALS